MYSCNFYMIYKQKSIVVGFIDGKKFFFLLGFLFCLSIPSFSATYYSRANANWNVASTWSTDGVLQCAGAAAAGVPGAGDDIVICNTYTVTVTASTTVRKITVNAGGVVSINTLITLAVSPNAAFSSQTSSNAGTIEGLGTFQVKSIAASTNTLNNTGTISCATFNYSATLSIITVNNNAGGVFS